MHDALNSSVVLIKLDVPSVIAQGAGCSNRKPLCWDPAKLRSRGLTKEFTTQRKSRPWCIAADGNLRLSLAEANPM